MWIAGLVALVVAGYCGYLLYSTRQRQHEMITTQTMTAQELRTLQEAATEAAGPGFFEQKCEVVGKAEARPSGTVKSEISETECLWHRHVVKRKYWTTERRRDSKGNYRTRRVEKEETVATRESEDPFHVRDETGTIEVRPKPGVFEHMRQVVDRFEPHNESSQHSTLSVGSLSLKLPKTQREGTVGYKYTEWVLTAGTTLYVLGTAKDNGGELSIDEPSLVSTKSEEELLAEAKKKERFSLVGGIAAAAVGVALILVDLLS
ncbi:GIDE domain-containing protein [Phytoactinopolyspora endophytica]|uniref:GIDE domain-containing protein n=1 Tax=Phytoactinopolyspora endophytica TaxID=1642495 RepID=UPI00101CB897|nr:GIDE domain-containing protein [Phytoactinopolyspora endophytica]